MGNAEATGQYIQLLGRSSSGDEGRIEISHVAGELFGLIALRIYRDKIHLQAITQARLFNCISHLGQGLHGQRTDIGATGITEKKQAPLSQQAIIVEYLLIVVDQSKGWQGTRLLAEPESRLEFDRLAIGKIQGAEDTSYQRQQSDYDDTRFIHGSNGVKSADYISTGCKHNVSIPESLSALTTIRDFIRWGSSEFRRHNLSFGHGFGSALDEARYLTLHALDLPYDWPESYFAAVVTEAERQQVIEILQLRFNSRQPAAYITHESWFCGLDFYVDERVLVPRSPIAELIANQFEPWVDSGQVHRILDLCTGSGCIAIAAQYAMHDAIVCASDLSRDALEVAAINCKKHEVSDHITLYQSDLFDAIPKQKFDVIVSNPPYVDAEDMAGLSEEFRYEPEMGLAAGSDGLTLVDRMLAQAHAYLNDHAALFIEVGNSQAAMMEKYHFLPMTWIDFEFGGGGVCCIMAEDLKQHKAQISQLAG